MEHLAQVDAVSDELGARRRDVIDDLCAAEHPLRRIRLRRSSAERGNTSRRTFSPSLFPLDSVSIAASVVLVVPAIEPHQGATELL
jgi:hypothetical protein